MTERYTPPGDGDLRDAILAAIEVMPAHLRVGAALHYAVGALDSVGKAKLLPSLSRIAIGTADAVRDEIPAEVKDIFDAVVQRKTEGAVERMLAVATRPRRIQLRRTKGWRMPPNTVKVDRSTKWGNPFKPETSAAEEVQSCVEAHRAWLGRAPEDREAAGFPIPPDPTELRGKNLACWCRLDQPCHADVLLDLANKEDEQ